VFASEVGALAQAARVRVYGTIEAIAAAEKINSSDPWQTLAC